MIPALAIILCFQLIGETISRGLGLTLPGPVIGLVLLVLTGIARPRVIEYLRPAALGLLGNLSLFFVPAGVGIIAHLGQFADNALGIGLALIVSTVLAIGVGALVFCQVARLTEGPAQQGKSDG
ncbi:CidA/LrgA family protein [Paracoccus sp. DMF-8]|uniref:CidA/LrgA family protein n=1 Tax=Paracoccus sp. DMF-8 TaxID=3019445 RepID=UPI0023E840E6|nr:CidA/LrgA family protein [Paracoccus sp. DMF-8]MDF3604960.1 CidA/LrgA family protein [Paracoccus sp. DMF-8]